MLARFSCLLLVGAAGFVLGGLVSQNAVGACEMHEQKKSGANQTYTPRLKPMVIAHRGGKKWAPENTMSGFKQSIDIKADGIELDIHKCKSGELVVIHDETLDRTTNGTGYVKEKTWSELSKLSAGLWFDKKFESEKIPLLKEVLALVDGKLVLNIEIKNSPVAYDGIEDDLLKMLDDYKYPDKIIISSFDHAVLKNISSKSDKYRLAFLGDALVYDVGGYANKLGASAWHPYHGELRIDNVEQAHKNNLMVNVWTVNETKDWNRMRSLKVDGIVTDDPAGLIDYLKTM
ncbi:glycerophosphodiester phosphodiesterase [bacterium]|nr:glycerophosphodiester phosphodiesterase [bacterium]